MLALVATAGCENGGADSAGWFTPARQQGERWTICCVRAGGPDHDNVCRELAAMLKQAPGIKPGQVRVRTSEAGSSVCYGEYVKVPAADGTLVFPPQMLADLEAIRELAVGYRRPFFLAVPECLDVPDTGQSSQWHISNARGDYTLQVAVFYNTPTFDQRQEVAQEYVQQLRAEGFPAYFVHEPVRSIVFVGDFEASDLVQSPDGQVGYGPRVEQLIQRRPQEFRYMTENGFVRKYQTPTGHMQPVFSQLVPVRQGMGGGLNY